MSSPKFVKYLSGEQVLTPFAHDKRVYIIKSGYVFAFTYDDTGKRRIHLIYGPGSYFPVITTFFDKQQRASYEALTACEIEQYSQTEFTKRIESDHSFTIEILNKTVNQLAIFADRVVELQTTKLEDRLLMKLKQLVKECSPDKIGEVITPFPLKHHHLADMLGVERESISRALDRLKKQGLVREDSRGQWVITITE